MSLSAFGEKAVVPTDEMLAASLSETKSIWQGIRQHLESSYENISGEWKYYSKSAGWTFVLKSGKRTLLYLIPLKDYFKATFVFGERAAQAAQAADFPKTVLNAIAEAKQYMEGRSFMVDVKTGADAVIIEKLLKIKNDN